nr:trna-specific adenosine deaminase 1 [Quercus suber]
MLTSIIWRGRNNDLTVANVDSSESDNRRGRFYQGVGRMEESIDLHTGLLCAALATGMKCLPQSKIAQARGNVLHDWHAEILAIRAFNRWLVDECLVHGGGVGSSSWVQWNKTTKGPFDPKGEVNEEASSARNWRRPFALRPDVDIYMYVSEAPCGDASMELTMAEQEDKTPWSDRSALSPANSASETLLGRGHFSRLGIVRRKPARPDAPPTLSKSCSDKLALKQCTGLLNSATSLLLEPRNIYLRTLVLPQHRLVEHAVNRAFGSVGRMKAVEGRDIEFEDCGYGVKFFDVLSTKTRFEFEKTEEAVPSNIATLSMAGLWTGNRGGNDSKTEILINGVLQGRKQFDPRGASCVSRQRMVEAVAVALGASGTVLSKPETGSYAEMKQGPALEGRRAAKKKARELALQGWVRNQGDDDWNLRPGD